MTMHKDLANYFYFGLFLGRKSKKSTKGQTISAERFEEQTFWEFI